MVDGVNGLFARMAARALGIPPGGVAPVMASRPPARRDPRTNAAVDDPFDAPVTPGDPIAAGVPAPAPAHPAPVGERSPRAPFPAPAVPATPSPAASHPAAPEAPRRPARGDVRPREATPGGGDERGRRLAPAAAADPEAPSRAPERAGEAARVASPVARGPAPWDATEAPARSRRTARPARRDDDAATPLMGAQAGGPDRATPAPPLPAPAPSPAERASRPPAIIPPGRGTPPGEASREGWPRPLEPGARERAAPAVPTPRPGVVIEELRVEVVPPPPPRRSPAPAPPPPRPRPRSAPPAARPPRQTFGLGQM